MSLIFNGNGNGNGNGPTGGLIRQLKKKPASPAPPSEVTENHVAFRTADGVALQGLLVRMTRHVAVFELYNSSVVPRFSEALTEFKIALTTGIIYSGRAIVSKVLDVGSKVVCEVMLEESHWQDLNLAAALRQDGRLAAEFKNFLREWQKLYKVSPEFKVIVADMQTFLHDLRLWMDQVEVGVRSQPAGQRDEFERNILLTLQEPVLSSLALLFERFEVIISKIEKEVQPAHSLYAKHLLHPLVLCSPFMHRTFQKPLGYAGDYEMVNMMLRNPFQGGSTFAKILNTFFLNTPPVVAHRNRIDHLVRLLELETHRVAKRGGVARVFNLGCGPALEIQRFLAQSQLSQSVQFTLLDFNDETVRFTQRALNHIKEKCHRENTFQIIKKSVAQVLKEASVGSSKLSKGGYDFVYCAGLFDYLSDDVCMKLLEIFYELAAPDGLVVVSNVDASNPARGWMEYVVDWHLVYRNAQQLAALLPEQAAKDATRVIAEPISVNIFAEIRKPKNV